MKKHILAAGVMLTLAASPALAQTKMVIGTGIDPSTSLFYVAEGGGFFKKNGLDVQLNLGSSGSAMIPLVVGNQLQAALGSELASIQVHNLDQKVVVVAEATRMPSWAGIVARDVPNLDSLKGKKVGVQAGSGSELMWMGIVKAKGLDVKDYKVVPVDPPEMVAALERRDIDAFVAFEPWMTRATMGVPNSQIIIDNQGILEPRNFVVMNKEWIEKNSAAANAFMKSLVEAAAYYQTNPNEAIDIVANKIKLDRPLTAALIGKIKVEVRLVEDSLNHLKKTEQQIAASGKLTKPVVWKDILYPAPLLAAQPDKVDASIPR